MIVTANGFPGRWAEISRLVAPIGPTAEELTDPYGEPAENAEGDEDRQADQI